MPSIVKKKPAGPRRVASSGMMDKLGFGINAMVK